MTSIRVRINHAEDPSSLWAVGDTRISGTGTNWPQVYIDEAPKVLTLDIACHESGQDGFLAAGMSPTYLEHSIGFAYAGSTLVGATTYMIASSIFDSLGDPTGQQSRPRLRDLADGVSRIASELGRSCHRNMGSTPSSEMLVFGYCVVEAELQVFQLANAGDVSDPARLDADLVIGKGSDRDDICIIGVDVDDVRNDIIALRASQDGESMAWWRAPLEALRRALDERRYPGIGGSPQLVVANQHGASLYQLVLPVDDRAPQARMTLFGVDMHEHIPSIGPCQVVRPALATGFPYEGFE